MDKMTDFEMIYKLSQSHKECLEELLRYLKQDSSVRDSRIEIEKEKLNDLKSIESNMSMFTKGRG